MEDAAGRQEVDQRSGYLEEPYGLRLHEMTGSVRVHDNVVDVAWARS